jgi:hypothetical protein
MTQPKTVTIPMLQLPVLIARENRTMSEFDWRSPETYAKLQAADFVREYLRRREDCPTRPNMISGSMRKSPSAFTD